MTKRTLTAHQQKVLRTIYNSNQPVIGFDADPTIKRLLALNLITFTKTAFGAGTIALRNGGR